MEIVLMLYVLIAISMTALILLQQGKGADMGASFGAGSSQTVFGAAGSASVLVKVTMVLGAIFFATSLGLAVHAKQQASKIGLIPGVAAEVVKAPVGDIPVAPASAPAAAPASAAADMPVAPAAK